MPALTLTPKHGYARALKLALLFSILGEAVIFLCLGTLPFPRWQLVQ